MRMDYRDAIKYLNEHNITRPGEDGVEGPHVVGDDIAEAAERKMTDQIGKPIFLMKFPMEIVRPSPVRRWGGFHLTSSPRAEIVLHAAVRGRPVVHRVV